MGDKIPEELGRKFVECVWWSGAATGGARVCVYDNERCTPNNFLGEGEEMRSTGVGARGEGEDGMGGEESMNPGGNRGCREGRGLKGAEKGD